MNTERAAPKTHHVRNATTTIVILLICGTCIKIHCDEERREEERHKAQVRYAETNIKVDELSVDRLGDVSAFGAKYVIKVRIHNIGSKQLSSISLIYTISVPGYLFKDILILNHMCGENRNGCGPGSSVLVADVHEAMSVFANYDQLSSANFKLDHISVGFK